MFQLMTLLMTSMMTILFTQTSHPLAMTLIIIIQTLLICLTVGFMTQSFWFSYILFLVFLGGMLVLFIYMTSMASNEMFSIPMKPILISTFFMFLFLIICMMMDPSMWMSLSTNNDMEQFSTILTSYMDNSLSLTKLYNKPTDLITLLLVMYLFLTLIAICKITNIFHGPLRQKT
uniref:NADH-ubiquinone oxidoreductase chain 6 n=1 Tax=Troglophilus neglectus TaxID=552514 RepID=B6DEE9_TRONE|nr:NADH dehydrogenase subunit 6 [Troglophilus neglectus]ACG59345.1 NADH dehydrogenase subunit 6 [Troglophilus neglectus]